ncbi:MAG TPA: VWA domain-containing protein [Spirochaetia bacterium]|nr:VWA domain-containing protein [Spirochaetia bacterium]
MKRIWIISLVLLVAFTFSPLTAQTAAPVKVQVVFVLDTTGSMSSLIDAAKEKIWAIAGTLATAEPAPDISMGLLAYRDRQDEYITKLTALTPDLDAVYSNLMDFRASGGGDGPESVNQALAEAVGKFEWDPNPAVYKVIFLVGDWPPHMDYRDDVKYPVSSRNAKAHGIIVNTIQMGNQAETAKIWKEIARITGGEYYQVGHENLAVHYETPFDAEIAELAKEYDATRVYYGTPEAQSAVRNKREHEEKLYKEAPDSVIAQRNMYNLSEAGKTNFSGSYDLVDQVMNGEVTVEDIKNDELPAELKTLSAEERKRFIEEKIRVRKEYEAQLTVLNEKRQAYIRELVKKNADHEENSFDTQVYRGLKKQGAEKNLHLDKGMSY